MKEVTLKVNPDGSITAIYKDQEGQTATVEVSGPTIPDWLDSILDDVYTSD